MEIYEEKKVISTHVIDLVDEVLVGIGIGEERTDVEGQGVGKVGAEVVEEEDGGSGEEGGKDDEEERKIHHLSRHHPHRSLKLYNEKAMVLVIKLTADEKKNIYATRFS